MSSDLPRLSPALTVAVPSESTAHLAQAVDDRAPRAVGEHRRALARASGSSPERSSPTAGVGSRTSTEGGSAGFTISRPASLPPSVEALEAPLGTRSPHCTPRACYPALRRLPGMDFHPLDRSSARVSQSFPNGVPSPGRRSAIVNTARGTACATHRRACQTDESGSPALGVRGGRA